MTEALPTNEPAEHRQPDIDEREAQVITEGRFFELYKEDIRQLFSALGRDGEWSDDPADMLGYMRRGWIGNEHGNATEKDQFTEEQIADAMPILERMGFTSELLPAEGEEFDQALVVGGTMVANYRRTELIRKALKQGTAIDEVILWTGQRPREKRDGSNDELTSTEGRFAGHDITENPWMRALAGRGALDASQIDTETGEAEDPWALTETDFGRMAVNKVMDGELTPRRMGLQVVDVNNPHQELPDTLPDAPARDITDYQYETEDGQAVTIMNAAAVPRGDRPSRHTTESCTEEWLERHAPKQGAKVLYVTGNPHSLRTTRTTYRTLQKYGRGDIELVVAGTSPAAGTPIQSYLGEVARLIDNEVRRNQANE